MLNEERELILMRFSSLLTTGLKGKLVLAALVGTTVVGGTTAAMAATPTGQQIVHQITRSGDFLPFSTPDKAYAPLPGKATSTPGATVADKNCPTSAEVKQLTSKYALSNTSSSAAVKAICSLNNGTFTGKTTKGVVVKSSRPLSYDQIDQLLAYAKRLATQNKVKLTASNISTYLADALQSLGKKWPDHFGPNKGMPGKGFHAKPTGTPGAWPTGTPRVWPTGTPKAWPTGTPVARPTGTPKAWPTPILKPTTTSTVTH